MSRVKWDADALRDAVRCYVVENPGHPEAALVADDTQAIKMGDKSVGVAHQYCGLTGQIENCQVMPMLATPRRPGTPSSTSVRTCPKPGSAMPVGVGRSARACRLRHQAAAGDRHADRGPGRGHPHLRLAAVSVVLAEQQPAERPRPGHLDDPDQPGQIGADEGGHRTLE
ncbi:transposase [Nonomuraea sp. KC401]|nr:hypothetical protein [Nonomuraea sp. K271]TLF79772.1 transposase [Nonomuraea sp. KC401]